VYGEVLLRALELKLAWRRSQQKHSVFFTHRLLQIMNDDAASEQVIRSVVTKSKRLLEEESDSSPPSSPDSSGQEYRDLEEGDEDDDEEAGDEDDQWENGDVEVDTRSPAHARPSKRARSNHGGRRDIVWEHHHVYALLTRIKQYRAHVPAPDCKRKWARMFSDLAEAHLLPGSIDRPSQLSKKLTSLLKAKHPLKRPPFVAFDPSLVPQCASGPHWREKVDHAEALHAQEQQRLQNEYEEMCILLESFRRRPAGTVKEHVTGTRCPSKQTKKLSPTEKEDEIIESIQQHRADKKEHANARWERERADAEEGTSNL
jgi:hypothetical protein